VIYSPAMPMSSRAGSLSLPPGHRFGAVASSAGGSLLVAGMLGAFAGTAVAVKPTLAAAAIAAAVGCVGCVVALERPALAFAGIVVLLGLIPIYAAPSAGPILLLPASAAAWLLAGALAWRNFVDRGQILKLNLIDYAAGAFVLLMFISLSFSERGTRADLIQMMFLWAGPYLAARLLLRETDNPVRVVALSFATVAAILAPVALAEASGLDNPFYVLKLNPTESAIWGSQVDRLGQVRAETAFGHPIVFSMFAAASALFSLAMGVASTSGRARYAWYAAAGTAVFGQALALSRTGWLVLVVGAILFVAVSAWGPLRRQIRIMVGALCVGSLIALLLVPTELQVLPGLSERSDPVLASSGQYRQALLERALEPGVLGLWGNPVNMITPAVGIGSATDNAYVVLADTWGLVPTTALIAIVLAMLVTTWRSARLQSVGHPVAILPIVAFSSMVGLLFVAFITQGQAMIWLLVGAAAVIAEKAQANRSTGTAQLRNSGFER
jgi:hypothetical protein